MMKKLLLIFGLFVFLVLPGRVLAAGGGHDGHSHAQEEGAAAKALSTGDIRMVTPEELKAKINSGAEIVFLDMRSPGAYVKSTVKIKGALRIDPNHLKERVMEIPFGKQIATYCT